MTLLNSKIGWLTAGAAILLASACSTEDPMPRADAGESRAASEVRSGSVLAEYETREGAESSRLSVHAQFIEAEGVSYTTALEALEVWHPDWELDRGACSLRSGDYAQQSDSADIRLDLLDLGPISVQGPTDSLELEPRRLPDLLSAFSGVIYGTEGGFDYDRAPLPYEPGAVYRFEAPGTETVDGFSVELQAPAPVRIESVAGRSTEGVDTIALPDADDLEIRWGAASDDAAVFLDLSSGFGPDRPRLTCRVEDDGLFTIPSSLLEQFDVQSGVDVALRRVHATDARVDGFDDSEVILSAVDEVTVYRD
ncbi:MAG: hypothetical protein ACQEVA_21300 [Myxococcota bacterium]